MKRFLTKDEIEYILDFIKPTPGIPKDTAMSILNNIKDSFRNQLIKEQIYPEIIDLLKESIKKKYVSSLIQPGESVGVICAQSIGEKQTQCTLNTFHKAGMSEKTMTSGVPRFQELINATKNPRNVNHKIYFKNNNDTIQNIRNNVNHTIVGLKFKDISLSIDICLNKEEELWYDSFKLLYNDIFTKYANCISIKLNKNKLFEYKIDMKFISDVIEKEFEDICCVFSPISISQLDIFVNIENIELPEDRVLFINHENKVEIYLEECVKKAIENINICGIECINEIFYTKENEEWIVETNGINSRDISPQNINFKNLLSLENVDSNRTISNNLWDIYEVLGIEATRDFLISEFMEIMDGINPCHSQLLVDRMTHGGTISSITRYTMKKDESGPFGRASFEESMDNFVNAAMKGEIEPTKGISASIICGKRSSIGTGMMDLRLDMRKIMKHDE